MNTIPRKLGRYLIIREIGRGAMGVVYKAHDPVIEREVAIKAINLNFQVTEEEKAIYLNRFYREAKAAGKLNHPGIVTIYDVDEDHESSTPFIVMEFLEGTTLQDLMSSGVILPIDQSTRIIIEVAEALGYAHEHDVVHRDVKSANILILNDSKAKITDFGIARLASSDLTRSGQFIGTPNYMSPEQIEGKTQVDGRSDLFSLGVIYYMLLTGERPFNGDSFNTVAYKIVNVDPLPAKALNAEVPEGYNDILQKLLAKDPEQRYSTAAELVTDLKRTVDPAFVPESQRPPIPIPSPSLSTTSTLPGEPQFASEKERIASSQTITLFGRRHAKWAILAGSLILILSAVAAGSYFYAKRKTAAVVVAKVTTSGTQAASGPGAQSVAPSAPVNQLDNQEIIRRKWDLAMNYYKNALYDKSIEQLQSILVLNPNDQEAKKYLDLANQQKLTAQTKKQPGKKNKAMLATQTASPTNNKAVAKTKSPRLKKSTAPKPEPVIVPVTVNFEMIHNFPSGVLNIYLGSKLIYQTEFQGTKKKVFLFTNYQGKVTGSFSLPPGDTTVQIQVVAKQPDLTILQDSKISLQEGAHPFLRIRYLKATKQLEVKWI